MISMNIHNVREIKVRDRYFVNKENPFVTRQLTVIDSSGKEYEITFFGEIFDDIQFGKFETEVHD